VPNNRHVAVHGQEQRLAEKAYRRILDMILSGDVRPGDHLNERGLGKLLDMSRTPIRDALLMLEAEGLVVRHGRLGVQIKQMQLEEFMEALQIRQLLEPAIAGMAAGKVSVSKLDEIETELNAVLATCGPDAELVDRSRTSWIDDRLHGLISDSAGNSQLTSIVQTLRRKTQIFELKNVPERTESTCKEHLEIISGLRAGDGDRTAAAMSQHLDMVKASILAKLAWK